jgi:hypothetical protein
LLDIPLGGFDALQLHGQQEAVVLLDTSLQGADQFGALTAQTSLRQVRHLFGRGLTLDQRPQHGPAGDAKDIGGDAAELDVGGLQQTSDPIENPVPLALQVCAAPGQIA